MGLIFLAGFATVILVTAMLTDTPMSGSAGKDYHFNLGNQKSCHENVSDNFDKYFFKKDIHAYKFKSAFYRLWFFSFKTRTTENLKRSCNIIKMYF